jgi:hypothetical protein
MPGNGATYDPPNELDEDVVTQLKKPEADYFGEVTPRFSLPPPPGNGGDVRKELDALLQLKDTVRAGLMLDINSERKQFFKVFERVLGIDGQGAPAKTKTLLLMAALCDVTNFWVMRSKQTFNRPRPVQLEPRLDPPFCPGHAAYPSAHSSAAHACALALIEATDSFPPALHVAITKAAERIAYHREVAGVHYPSDSTCGALFAKQLVSALKAHSAKHYDTKIAEVRAELKKIVKP